MKYQTMGMCEEKVDNGKIIFKEDSERHGQKICRIIEERVETHWKKMIEEIKPSEVFINCRAFHVRDVTY